MKYLLSLLLISPTVFAGEVTINMIPSDKQYTVFANREDGRFIRSVSCTSPCNLKLGKGRYVFNVQTGESPIMRGSTSVRHGGETKINLELDYFGY